ncbi:HesB/IscA family protein [Desulfosediminicola flagellatus]|uniref:HesB/IscA family protein n=1 Tax=Desulfosediminicola flagellatus TaxID=2569541 RepID=UPI0010AC1C60|nr:iron-sulfur cluster assembly accessory protein [Desulfosediminicola flagellatus]
MLTITDKARMVLHQQGAGGEKFLRILVKSGGCAGMTYDAEIDDKKLDGEKTVLTDGDIGIVSNEESIGFLKGLVIDYSDDLISAGFRFSNSSNESSCGCGASFTLSGFPTFDKGGATCGS